MWVRWIFAAMMLVGASAYAGPVKIISAEASITFFSPDGSQPATVTKAVELGDFDSLNFNGATSSTPARGDARVFYSFQPFKNGFQLFVQTTHLTSATDGAGGNASFRLEFSSSVPLKLTFESSVLSPPALFSASTQSIYANAQFAGNNTWEGSIPHSTNANGDVEFGLFQKLDTIPAGINTSLAVDSITYDPKFAGPSKSDGYLKFNVEPVVSAVPLPSPVWPALLCAVAGFVLRCNAVNRFARRPF